MQKKKKTVSNGTRQRAMGLGRETREETVKWNQMTTLRFQTGGGDIRHPPPPFGGPPKKLRD